MTPEEKCKKLQQFCAEIRLFRREERLDLVRFPRIHLGDVIVGVTRELLTGPRVYRKLANYASSDRTEWRGIHCPCQTDGVFHLVGMRRAVHLAYLSGACFVRVSVEWGQCGGCQTVYCRWADRLSASVAGDFDFVPAEGVKNAERGVMMICDDPQYESGE